jgi:hypothetical protein
MAKVVAKKCLCGCEQYVVTPTSKFRPGHDSIYKSHLFDEADHGSPEAMEKLNEMGWNSLYDRHLESTKKKSHMSGVIDAKVGDNVIFRGPDMRLAKGTISELYERADGMPMAKVKNSDDIYYRDLSQLSKDEKGE